MTSQVDMHIAAIDAKWDLTDVQKKWAAGVGFTLAIISLIISALDILDFISLAIFFSGPLSGIALASLIFAQWCNVYQNRVLYVEKQKLRDEKYGF